MRARTRARASAELVTFRILYELPQDMQLRVADSLDDPRDCARLCLALPPLGLLAMRSVARYQQFIFRVGMQLALRGTAIDDVLFRRYARDQRANYDGVIWLNAAAAAEGSAWSVLVQPDGFSDTVQWTLRHDLSMDTVLRVENRDAKLHFEGGKGAERRSRIDLVQGGVNCGIIFFEGPRGAERQSRIEHPTGCVAHYEGEQGFERTVRIEHPNEPPSIFYYEGAKNAERCVRSEQPREGLVNYFEGAKDHERQVCACHVSGCVIYFEGARGAERPTRAIDPEGRQVLAAYDSEGRLYLVPVSEYVKSYG